MKHFRVEIEAWTGGFDECTSLSFFSHWRRLKPLLRWARSNNLKAVVEVHHWRNPFTR